MEKTELLKQRLKEIVVFLEKSGEAWALLSLGSCGGNQKRMDRYSDLDIFVVYKTKKKSRFLSSIDWLASFAFVSFSFQNTVDG